MPEQTTRRFEFSGGAIKRGDGDVYATDENPPIAMAHTFLRTNDEGDLVFDAVLEIAEYGGDGTVIVVEGERTFQTSTDEEVVGFDVPGEQVEHFYKVVPGPAPPGPDVSHDFDTTGTPFLELEFVSDTRGVDVGAVKIEGVIEFTLN